MTIIITLHCNCASDNDYEIFRGVVRQMVEEELCLLVRKNKKMLSQSKTPTIWLSLQCSFQSRGSFRGNNALKLCFQYYFCHDTLLCFFYKLCTLWVLLITLSLYILSCLFVSEGFGIGCTPCTVERKQYLRLHSVYSYSGSAGKQLEN